MILDIRGTNGAGKSWIVHSLLKKYGNHLISQDNMKTGKGKILGHFMPKLDCAVLGSYLNTCGGCDGIKTADEIENRAREFAKDYRHVILEGIMPSHTHKRYSKLAEDLGDYYFLFLTSPVEVCIERVRARRLAKGNTKPFDPNKHMGLVSDYERVRAAYRNLLADGRNIIDLDYESPLPQIIHLFREYGAAV